MDLTEGVGESSSPPRSFGSFSGYDVRSDVFNRFVECGHEEAVSNPHLFREQIDSHFSRLPPSYGLDINMDRVEDVLLHQKLLESAKDPEKWPAYHIRFLENLFDGNSNDDQQHTGVASNSTQVSEAANGESIPLSKRNRECDTDFEPCSKLEDLNLDVKTSRAKEERDLTERFCGRGGSCNPIHEVIFSTVDKPKLLSQLSALLSDIGLNIREAHVFSTTDGYSLDIFVVDGWPVEETDGIYKAMEEAISRNEGSWSGSTHSRSSVDKALAEQAKSADWEIDRRLLKIGERIASGSCGDLFRGIYHGQDVAVKILRLEHLNDTQEDEFAQEVAILREVKHKNVVRFVGACTKSPHLCIVTEYMPGGSLYNYLHKNQKKLKPLQLPA